MTRSVEISNSDDVIDSRDVIARIDELDSLRQAVKDAEEALTQAKSEALELRTDTAADADVIDAAERLVTDIEAGLNTARNDFDDEAQAELKALESLAKEAEGYAADWRHGETLIRDSYFTEYAQELAADVGVIDPKAAWPLNCIDWDKAADELKIDYTEVDFDGVTYWVR